MTCAEFLPFVERSTKAMGMPMKLKADDWATVPAALRVLPPKATLCGSANTAAFIASPLFGKDLEAYYRPILEKMDCKPVKCEIDDKKTSCRCRGGHNFGMVRTEELSEVYAIDWM
jgi:hypothetical protein